jgi:hypothetical protein
MRDAAGFGDALQPRGDVDTVAEDIVPLEEYVAEMDTHAPFHSAIAGNARIALRRQLLQREGALDGTDHRGEFDQHAVAGGLDDPPAMLGDERIGGGISWARRRVGISLPSRHSSWAGILSAYGFSLSSG